MLRRRFIAIRRRGICCGSSLALHGGLWAHLRIAQLAAAGSRPQLLYGRLPARRGACSEAHSIGTRPCANINCSSASFIAVMVAASLVPTDSTNVVAVGDGAKDKLLDPAAPTE